MKMMKLLPVSILEIKAWFIRSAKINNQYEFSEKLTLALIMLKLLTIPGTYLPGSLKLIILPNSQFEYHQVEYNLEKYSTFSTVFT